MYKQVIVIRKDLKMEKGKIAAQSAHASLQAYKKADPKEKGLWELEGSKKVVLKAETLEELEDIFDKAKRAKLPCAMIRDAGRTQIPSGTITAVGIGPAEEKTIDKITGKLKML